MLLDLFQNWLAQRGSQWKPKFVGTSIKVIEECRSVERNLKQAALANPINETDYCFILVVTINVKNSDLVTKYGSWCPKEESSGDGT